MKGFDAMIFYINSNINDVNIFIKKLKNIPLAESLGGIETLITFIINNRFSHNFICYWTYN